MKLHPTLKGILPLLALLVGWSYFGGYWGSYEHGEPEYIASVLRPEGDALVDRIEEFRAEHGRYPRSLREAGIRAPKQRFGGWKYERSSDTFCELSIGVYRWNFFHMSWTPVEGWYLDR